MQFALFPLVALAMGVSAAAETTPPPRDTANCYLPVEGGWQIRITQDPTARRLKPGDTIGVVGDDAGAHRRDVGAGMIGINIVVGDDARAHRRPLYPPADRTLVWTQEELARRQRIPFRPMILAANEPRFVVDLDATAGGLCGHLLLGLSLDRAASKWLHQFSELEVRFVDGRMEYDLQDASFPGVRVYLQLMPLADSVGLVLKLRLEGVSKPGELAWVFGGASGFTSNYLHEAPQYKYSPEQCADNVIRWEKERFSLLRNGAAILRGGSSWPGKVGFGDPPAVMDSPAALCTSAGWCSTPQAVEEPKRVAVQRIRFEKGPVEGWIVIGRGGKIESFLVDPPNAEKLARQRCQSIVSRIAVCTPDPYLNQAIPMMALATEGLWGDAAILHGGWSWRQAYLGWRGWYGPLCYGWTDRVKRSIEQHCTLGLIRSGPDQGALGHMLEDRNSLFYNMNEVFIDHVRRYFEYTDDLELMRKVYPVLKGIVEWERRRLQPDTAVPLYESSLNTWISDSHWYIRGQCTTASAYMLGAYRLLAELAEKFGENPSPYREKAEAIRNAMQRKLWQPRRGVFAEYLDTLGEKQLHPEPELAAIYHSAEFAAADPLQIYQMLHWADNNLRQESTPGGGRAYWSSNWAPNAGRAYTHSTYELSYGEQLNLALTNFQVGRADEGYALIRSAICGIYNGLTPGGLSCHMYLDGRQRANNEFADPISMWGRAVCEGMFGIRPKRPRNVVELSPQFPSDWSEASIKTPQFSYRWKRDDRRILVEWESPVTTSVELRLPLRARRVENVTVDGNAASYRIEAGVGLTWLNVKSSAAPRGAISIAYISAEYSSPPPLDWKEGDHAALKLADYSASAVIDPQEVLQEATCEGGTWQGTVAGEPGARLLFLKSGTENCPFWLPLTVRIGRRQPVEKKMWAPPLAAKAKDLAAWTLVDMGNVFSASLPEVLGRVAKASQPPPPPALWVNHAYWKNHIVERIAQNCPSDAAWRRKIGPDQIGWTHDGIPFKSPKHGSNIAVVTRAGGFPQKITIPVGARGRELYLMLSGITFAMQSHVVNLRVALEYSDGSRQTVNLVNPFDIGDCWNTWLGRFHDTAANGFENLGGRFGPLGSTAAGDLRKPIAVDTEAHLLKFPLREDAELRSLTLEAVANDVVFGLMGASILK